MLQTWDDRDKKIKTVAAAFCLSDRICYTSINGRLDVFLLNLNYEKKCDA